MAVADGPFHARSVFGPPLRRLLVRVVEVYFGMPRVIAPLWNDRHEIGTGFALTRNGV